MQVVGLANTNVERAADFDETQKECPNIQDLDLSSTLISTWQDVADICAPLTKLTILRLRYTSNSWTLLAFSKISR